MNYTKKTKKSVKRSKKFCSIGFILLVCMTSPLFSQQATGDFASDSWDISRARIVDHLGRRALIGTAFLKNIQLKNGIIEVDITSTERSRSYPGVLFRMKDESNYERIYIRPHRSPFYNDSLQYAPVFNGVDSWQLYNGTGRTASLDILPNRWNHLKIVVAGDQAQMFWNDDTRPALIIDNLAHGEVSGTIGLSGPMDSTAFFSNFSYETIDNLKLPDIASREPVCGIITEWDLSTPFALLTADFTKYPDSHFLSDMKWQTVSSDKTGFVDISRYYPRNSRVGDCILARTTLTVETDTLLRLGFGYSDFITVFLNQQPLYFGNSAYQSRDRSFLGIVGYFDNVFLPLKKGKNELLIQVGERMGGWAFCFRKEDEVCHDQTIEKKWTIKGLVSMPESVVYDPSNSVCYVSNYYNEGKEYISKISLAGEVIAREWITGLRMPTGMCVKGNTLYVVDRSSINVIDIQKGEITEKIPLTGMRMPNDVTIDKDGNIYISDFQGNAVFRYSEGKLESWLENLDGPNGLISESDYLVIGQNEKLLIVNIKDKSVKTIADFEMGSNIDGLQADGKGNYLVSDYNGKLYRVSASGSKTLLLNTATPGTSIADFAFIPDRKLIVIPTLGDNSVVAYLLK